MKSQNQLHNRMLTGTVTVSSMQADPAGNVHILDFIAHGYSES